MDWEALIVPALLAGAAAYAWLAITAHRAELARAVVGVCREAVKLRESQEALRAAGKPAPHLDAARRAEEEVRDLLRRHFGLS